MLSGVIRYKRLCDGTGKTGTERVMQAQRFLGRDELFLEPWGGAVAPGTPWKPKRWTPPPDERGEVPTGFLTQLLTDELRKNR
jgi:hypothetical protein